MYTQFFEFADKLVRFSNADKQALVQSFSLEKVSEKTEIVEYGKKTDELFFINKGCVRKYYLKEGEEITIYIATENSFIVSFQSFLSNTPTMETIETLEECELLVLSRSDLDQLYTVVPAMNEFIRKVLELTLIQFQQYLTSFILDSPEERYLKLLAQNPHLLDRVPQHMLARWLGITATSLSRIRKRIIEKV